MSERDAEKMVTDLMPQFQEILEKRPLGEGQRMIEAALLEALRWDYNRRIGLIPELRLVKNEAS